MARAPLVEPPAPVFGAHQRRRGAQLPPELVVDVGPGAEVHRPYKVVEPVLGEVAGPVALEQRHVGKARGAHGVAYGGHIGLVFAVRAILILYLHHDDGASALYG